MNKKKALFAASVISFSIFALFFVQFMFNFDVEDVTPESIFFSYIYGAAAFISGAIAFLFVDHFYMEDKIQSGSS